MDFQALRVIWKSLPQSSIDEIKVHVWKLAADILSIGELFIMMFRWWFFAPQYKCYASFILQT